MGVVKVIVNGDTKMDITPTTADANEVNQGEVFFNRSGEQSVGTGDPPSTRVPKYGMGKNQIDNWYFVGGGSAGVFPVNQRGQSSYTGAVYGVDRWYGYANIVVTLSSQYISLSNTGSATTRFYQALEVNLLEYLNGKSCTLSILTNLGLFYTTDTFNSTATTVCNIPLYNGTIELGAIFVNAGKIRCNIMSGQTINIIAVKLELGSEQTLCHNEGTEANPVWVLNEVPDYEEELLKCQTNTADSTDTYANKSVATEQQIAYVETGNTASQAHNVGEYFCMGGLLYRATTAIPLGGTITPGTNCEEAVVDNWMPRNVLLSGGQSITITPNASSTSFTLLIAVQGNRTVTSGLYYVSGYSLNSSYHIITAIVNATQISVTSSGGVITAKNNHTDNLYMTVVILQTNGRMIIAKS